MLIERWCIIQARHRTAAPRAHLTSRQKPRNGSAASLSCCHSCILGSMNTVSLSFCCVLPNLQPSSAGHKRPRKARQVLGKLDCMSLLVFCFILTSLNISLPPHQLLEGTCISKHWVAWSHSTHWAPSKEYRMPMESTPTHGFLSIPVAATSYGTYPRPPNFGGHFLPIT